MKRDSAGASVIWGATQLAVTGILSRVLNLAVLVIVARAAPSEFLGQYVIAAAVGAFVFLASDVGLGQWLAREGAARPQVVSDLFSRSRALRTNTAALCFVAIGVWIGFRVAYGHEWIVVGGILLSFVLQSFAYEFECLSRAASRMHVELRSVLTGSTLTVMVIAVGPGMIGWRYAIPLSFILGSLARLAVARVLCGPATAGPPSAFSRVKLLREAIPYAVTTMVSVAFVQVDIILIAAVTSSETAAAYALVSRPLLAIGSLFAYAGNALIPSISRAAVSDLQLAFAWLRPLAFGAGLVGCLGTALAALAGPSLLVILYGSQIDSASLEMSRFAAIFLLFATCNAALGAFVTSIGRQLWRAYSTVTGLATVVLLTLLLVPRWPMAGALSQFVASEGAVTACLGVAVLRARFQIKKDGRFARAE